MAEAFYLMGEVEKYGTGLIRVRDWIKDYEGLTFNINEQGGAIVSKLNFDKVENFTGNVVEKRVDEILKLIIENPKISATQIAKTLNTTSRTIQRDLERLIQLKKVIRIGPAKGGYWEILE